MKPTSFKIVNLKPSVQKSKRGLDIEVKPLTKQAIKDNNGKIVAYIPDCAPEGTGKALLKILNSNNKVILP